MKYILALILSLSLAACTTTTTQTIPVTKLTIQDIPESFLDCKKPRLPDPKKLTNKQLSSLIFSYEKELNNCLENQEAIKKYIANLKYELSLIQNKDNK